jgi:cytochrome c-type biogenesis protein CcmE
MEKSTLAKIALTVAVVLGGGGFLIYSSVGHAQHYRMVDELVGDGFDKWHDKEMKVHGYVQAGSIVTGPVGQVSTHSFVLQKNGKKIRIFSQGPVPDTFKDQSEVVATGRLVKAADAQATADELCAHAEKEFKAACPIRTDAEQVWVVQATDLMAKCPSKYDGAVSNKLDSNFK